MFKSDYMHLIVFSSCTLKYRPLTVFSSKVTTEKNLGERVTKPAHAKTNKRKKFGFKKTVQDHALCLSTPTSVCDVSEGKSYRTKDSEKWGGWLERRDREHRVTHIETKRKEGKRRENLTRATRRNRITRKVSNMDLNLCMYTEKRKTAKNAAKLLTSSWSKTKHPIQKMRKFGNRVYVGDETQRFRARER